MPELPEVETIARTLSPHIINNTIISATLLRAQTLHDLSMPIKSLEGCTIVKIRRRAKLLIFDLLPATPEGPTLLLIHLRMTGRLYTTQNDCIPNKHTRCWFLLQMPSGTNQCLFFDDIRTFGKLFVAREEILSNWEFWKTLGPEPLEMPDNALFTRLKGKRPIKSTLLDQKVIAGLGNIYVDEALFGSGIKPTRATESINEEESRKLQIVLKNILKKAISKKGSSIRDYRDADGNAGNFQKEFFVYGRGGKPCKICGTPLETTHLGGRNTVYCKQCQK